MRTAERFSQNWTVTRIRKTIIQKRKRFWSDDIASWRQAGMRIDGFCQARDMRCYAEVGMRAHEALLKSEVASIGKSPRSSQTEVFA